MSLPIQIETAKILVDHAMNRVDKQHEDLAAIEKKAERQRDFLTKLFASIMSLVGALTWWAHSEPLWMVHILCGAVCCLLYAMSVQSLEGADSVVKLARAPGVDQMLPYWAKPPEDLNLAIVTGLGKAEDHNRDEISKKSALLKLGLKRSRRAQYAIMGWIVITGITLTWSLTHMSTSAPTSSNTPQTPNQTTSVPASSPPSNPSPPPPVTPMQPEYVEKSE